MNTSSSSTIDTRIVSLIAAEQPLPMHYIIDRLISNDAAYTRDDIESRLSSLVDNSLITYSMLPLDDENTCTVISLASSPSSRSMSATSTLVTPTKVSSILPRRRASIAVSAPFKSHSSNSEKTLSPQNVRTRLSLPIRMSSVSKPFINVRKPNALKHDEPSEVNNVNKRAMDESLIKRPLNAFKRSRVLLPKQDSASSNTANNERCLMNKLKKRQELLANLQRVKSYHELHDTDNLRALSSKWLCCCQDALLALQKASSDHFVRSIDMAQILSQFRVEPDFVHYDVENDSFS